MLASFVESMLDLTLLDLSLLDLNQLGLAEFGSHCFDLDIMLTSIG